MKLKEEDLARAEEVLVKLKKNLINKIEYDQSPWKNSWSNNKIFLMATDICLQYVKLSDPDMILDWFNQMKRYRHGVNGNKEMEGNAFVLFQCAIEESHRFDLPLLKERVIGLI